MNEELMRSNMNLEEPYNNDILKQIATNIVKLLKSTYKSIYKVRKLLENLVILKNNKNIDDKVVHIDNEFITYYHKILKQKKEVVIHRRKIGNKEKQVIKKKK